MRELVVECCSELPEPFSMSDVLAWFRARHPAVAVNTVRTQFHGLLGRGELPVERSGRGEYRRTVSPGSAATVDSAAATPAPGLQTSGRVILLGCVKTKASTPAPARSLYVSPLWQRRVAYAETVGELWFVLSSKHGVVDPDDVIAPYDVSLRTMSAAYRTAWGQFAAQQLAVRYPLAGLTVEIHAGGPYVDAVRGPLSRLGAVVEDPVDARSMGATLSWYDNPTAQFRPPVVPAPSVDEQAGHALAALREAEGALRLDALCVAPSPVLDRPGLYSWWVDSAGAADLSRGLGTPVAPGLIYAGQAGASREGGTASSNTLRGRLVGMHVQGSRRMSTLRLSLSAVLDHAYGVDGGEDELTAWMCEHLRVAVWPTDDRDSLRFVEHRVLATLDPPLNLQHMAPSPLRRRLSQLRTAGG